MNLAHPEALWGLLGVVAVALFVARREVTRRRVLARFAAPRMLDRLAADFSPGRAWIKCALLVGGLACLVVALSGPQWGSQLVHIERRGMDVMLAVDCSDSMNAQDFKPSRLQVARRELGDLVGQLEGNRLGLVGFAGAAFVFCPLTLDLSATHLFLEQMDTNAIPVPGTAIGDAIRTCMNAFPPADPNARAIILLSDGEDHHSDPLGAAREAAKRGIVIHVVGIGSATGEPIPEGDAGGSKRYLKDASGKIVMSRLDDKTLQEIARITGGIYTHATPGADMLSPIVDAIGRSQKRQLESNLQRRYHERFQIFLALGIALLVLERLVGLRASNAQPRAREVAA